MFWLVLGFWLKCLMIVCRFVMCIKFLLSVVMYERMYRMKIVNEFIVSVLIE